MFKNTDSSFRLLIAVSVSGIVFLLLPSQLLFPTRVIIAWDSGFICLLALIWSIMISATPQKMRYRAQHQDANRWLISSIVIGAACASLLAIVFMLKSTPKGSSPSLVILHLSLSALTIVTSWLLIHTVFTLRYAHRYYSDNRATSMVDDSEGLDFPNEKKPDYWDFLYFSFVIGMTFQVSDVQIASRPMRRLALVHAMLSFFFNTVIFALSVNLIAGLF